MLYSPALIGPARSFARPSASVVASPMTSLPVAGRRGCRPLASPAKCRERGCSGCSCRLQQSGESQLHDLALLFRGNAKLGLGVIRETPARDGEKFLGTLTSRAHDIDVAEAPLVFLVERRHLSLDGIIGIGDARLLTRGKRGARRILSNGSLLLADA